jgi:hypothetical protein
LVSRAKDLDNTAYVFGGASCSAIVVVTVKIQT